MKTLGRIWAWMFQLYLALGLLLVVGINISSALGNPTPAWWDGSWIALWFRCLVGYGVVWAVSRVRRRRAAAQKGS